MPCTDALHDSLDVYEAEWRTIQERRFGPSAALLPPATASRSLSGLALSGGGIRSATFNLGVLQALNRNGLLDDFDYLSTVSGGGFVGGWWSAWLTRSASEARPLFPDDERVETWRHHVRHRKPGEDASPAEPDPIHHVRLFSNYLTPRKGALSPDLWRAVTIAARNLILTWAALLPFLGMGVVLAQAAFLWVFGRPEGLADRAWAAFSLPMAFLAWFVVLAVVWLLLLRGGSRGQWAITVGASVAIVAAIGMRLSGDGGLPTAVLVISTLVIAAAAVRVFWSCRALGGDDKEVLRNRVSQMQTVALLAALATGTIGAAVAFGADLINHLFVSGQTTLMENIAKYLALLTTAASTFHSARSSSPAGGADVIPPKQRSVISRLLLRLAPSLTMLTLLLATVWAADWAARSLNPAVWTPALRDASLIGAIAMAGYALSEKRHPSTPGVMVGIFTGTVIAGVLLTVRNTFDAAALVLAAASIVAILWWGFVRRPATDNQPPGLDRTLQLFGAASLLVVGVAAVPLMLGSNAVQVRLLLGFFALLFTSVILIGWTTDPNRLSLHTFYKMRLVRAYLGASNPNRGSNEAEDVTETVPDDDVPLSRISGGSGRSGPYHLINATLNLTTGNDLVIAQRAAAPFLFSRHFCGSPRTGFRRTERYRGGSLTLGTAVAISGAAASPVMGSQTPSTATSMLMAFLNVRLGYWVPTPSGMDWEAPQARFWPFYLLREFFSHLADTGSHCYVTDGGHFDNTGVYPLIERGCQRIVLTDCGADPDAVFDDLANLVRRSRIDFGAEITFPSLAAFSRETLAADRKPYVRGQIRYQRAHLNALGWTIGDDEDVPVGSLFVIKPTLLAALETDISRYSQEYGDFPQQTTADQWFDEAQFESYRRLGEKSGMAALAELKTLERAAPVAETV
ncbi:MAG TPA: patatin-like phospholipase family protein [Vicinamibacterales bacterium]